MARWRAYSNRLSLNHINKKVIGDEVASQFWYMLWQINLENLWWRGGEHIQTGSLWRIWIQNSQVARWRAITRTCFEKSFLKIIGGEVASIFKQALFESYESKSQWWRGGEPVLIQTLIIQSWKSMVARWRSYPNRLSLNHMNQKVIGGKVASHSWH